MVTRVSPARSLGVAPGRATPGDRRRPRWTKSLLDVLEARRHTRLLTALRSLLVTAKRREPCLVRPTDGGWIHRYRQGVAVHPRLGGPSARQQDEAARDHFLYDYEPRPGDIVLDVGAGVGGEVRLFSRLVGAAGRVVSIEAHPATFGLLVQTIELNALTNATALQLALAGRTGTVHIENDAVAHVSNGLTMDVSAGVPVPGHTLPDVMRMAGVDHIDLLKMNIEGAELAALRGAEDCLDRVAHVVVSCHDFKADCLSDRGGPGASNQDVGWLRTYEPVIELLRWHGFTIRTRPGDARPWLRYYVYGSR